MNISNTELFQDLASDLPAGMESAGRDMESASEALRKHDHQSAVRHLLEMLDCQPQNDLARITLAQCYARLNMPFAAIRAFQHLANNCPDHRIRALAEVQLNNLNTEVDEIVRRNIEARFGTGH